MTTAMNNLPNWAADVLSHLLVLLRGRGLGLADAARVLDDRRG